MYRGVGTISILTLVHVSCGGLPGMKWWTPSPCKIINGWKIWVISFSRTGRTFKLAKSSLNSPIIHSVTRKWLARLVVSLWHLTVTAAPTITSSPVIRVNVVASKHFLDTICSSYCKVDSTGNIYFIQTLWWVWLAMWCVCTIQHFFKPILFVFNPEFSKLIYITARVKSYN